MNLTTRNASSAFVLTVGILSTLLSCLTGNTHAFEEVKKTPPKQSTVKRQDNLDHWDSDTLAYYLDNYPGYDLAVMFYAQWDNNSHRLAPMWNQIAVLQNAGTTQSNLIMALFDCELNAAHMTLCSSLGITHYPTMTFIGSGPFYDTDPISKFIFGKKSAGVMGESPIPNTVKFQGNWQYGDSILDWIKTMQALSRWHIWTTQGFGKRLRSFFLPQRQKSEQLPLGVPGGASSSGTAASAATTGTSKSDTNVAFLEEQVEQYKTKTEDLTKIAIKGATTVEALLFNQNAVDMFALLDEHDAWKDVNSYTTLDDIYRACVLETSLDYCQRLASPMGTKVVDELIAADLSSDELMAASNDIEKLIMDEIAKTEPYCATLDTCIETNMKDEVCRPKTCPFNNEVACRMLTTCKDTVIVKEYADVLKLDMDDLTLQAAAADGKASVDSKK